MRSIQVIAYDNGVGLSRDLRLLTDLLDGHFDATITRLPKERRGRRAFDPFIQVPDLLARWKGERTRPHFDINLMIERIRPAFQSQARVNLLLPHPDWFKDSDRRQFGVVDGVVVKTRHAVDLFAPFGASVQYVGFTSVDRMVADVPREKAFFHLAGRSENKGTDAVLELWQHHPEWPPLTVVQHPDKVRRTVSAANVQHVIEYIAEGELLRMQNAHRFHLCPSETEGFGHHLVEAASVGALIVTVDAPPMNEMVTPERGVLVPFVETGTQRLATTYFVDRPALESAIEKVIAMDDRECDRMSAASRSWWQDNDREFRKRFVDALQNWSLPS